MDDYNKVRRIDTRALFNEVNMQGGVDIYVTEEMSGLEDNPCNDWLYFGLKGISQVLNERPQISSAAFIGSGNGIDVIASESMHKFDKIIVTDILPDILPHIKSNIDCAKPITADNKTRYIYANGRDCEPIQDKVDFIYANLPLLMSKNYERDGLSTTTLTDPKHYEQLSRGNNDPLEKWSLLSQLGFLNSAREKLNESGSIITMMGGRVPYESIQECFDRANMEYRLLLSGFKRQSDPQFLKEYAEYEEFSRARFIFFDENKLSDLLHNQSIKYPGIVEKKVIDYLHEDLLQIQLTSAEAYAAYKKGKNVSHIAYCFEATPSAN